MSAAVLGEEPEAAPVSAPAPAASPASEADAPGMSAAAGSTKAVGPYSGKIVLLVGPACGEKEAFGEELAAACGGSLLSSQALQAAASAADTTEGKQLREILESGKLVPADLQLDLLLKAMSSSSPPFLLPDFPRMAVHLKLLEAKAGSVPIALGLQVPGVEADRASAALSKHLSPIVVDVGVADGHDASINAHCTARCGSSCGRVLVDVGIAECDTAARPLEVDASSLRVEP